jgi:hypothetical protein
MLGGRKRIRQLEIEVEDIKLVARIAKERIEKLESQNEKLWGSLVLVNDRLDALGGIEQPEPVDKYAIMKNEDGQFNYQLYKARKAGEVKR